MKGQVTWHEMGRWGQARQRRVGRGRVELDRSGDGLVGDGSVKDGSGEYGSDGGGSGGDGLGGDVSGGDGSGVDRSGEDGSGGNTPQKSITLINLFSKNAI
jgi:hypothetical protein